MNTQSVETIDALKAFIPLTNGQIIFVNGYRAGSTDGHGWFKWDESSTETTIDGFVIKQNLLEVGRYKRILTEYRINVLDAGAYRDGSAETHTHVKNALNYAVSLNIPCYAPKGLYLVGGRIDPTLGNEQSVFFYGDGDDATWFKERDGLTLEIGRYNMMFYFLYGNNIIGESIVLKNFAIDKNGRTSPAASPSDYLHEQSHCVGIASSWTNSKIKNVIIENVKTKDKTGAGICFTQGYIDKAQVKNIRGVDYQHIGGQRGDFEFQAVISDLVVESSSGNYAQCEPNMTSAPSGTKMKAKLKDCNYQITEFTAFRDTHDAQTIEFDNHDASENLLLRWVKVVASNSRFRVDSSNQYWEGLAKGSIFEDCEVTVKVDTSTNTFKSFYPRSSPSMPTFIKFKGGRFKADDTANSATTGYAVNNAAVYSGAQDYLVEFEDVEFDTIFERTANCYANGNYSFKRCKLAARTGSLGALSIGSYSTYYANVTLESNDLSQISSPYIIFYASNTLWAVNFKGVHDFEKSTFTSNNLLNTEACAKAEGYFTADSVPIGKGIIGWRVKIIKPAFGYASEFICTTTSSTTPVYQLQAQAGVKKDTTANRPSSLTAASMGLRYLDTTLAAGGEPITFNGSAWVDATGKTV